ncbi:hypothetical protein ACFXAE_23735 [Streptomyces sp. NPDC059454]|uniref:hypothetical protein n=1 Tax=Streptomyces sp. NPDC059454 TaxID=3346836 RepID=UPI0036A70295
MLTREQLAERLDYSHASVASVEQGRFRRMGRNSAGMPKRTRSTLVVVLLIWSLFAFPWFDKGCDIAEAYTAVIKYGVPEGLEPLPACYG